MMNKVTERKINIEPITGESYYDYTVHPDNKTGVIYEPIKSWISERVNNYFENLAALRVYQQK